MKVLIGVLEEEEERLNKLAPLYEKEIAKRPKGCLAIKEFGKHRYAYLNYRQGKKVKTRYLGLESAAAAKAHKKQIEERRRYEGWLREVRQNLRFLHRVLHARRKG